MNLNKFKVLFAFRNVSRNKKSSLVVILTLSLVFCLTIMLFSMRSTFSRVYELQALNQYNDTDIVMTYDEYSRARLINKRLVSEDYGDYFNYVLSFFNINVLVESDQDTFYAQMISSLPHEFEIIVDQDVLITSNSIIISESLSNKYHLHIGDSIRFTILDSEFVYNIGDIFPDTGIFSGSCFYIDKEQIMSDIYGISSLSNLGNTLYLNVKDSYDIDSTIQLLKADDNYSDYHIFPTVDWTFISNKAMDLSSMLLALGLIVLLAMVMVLDSLFPIVLKDIRQQQAVVKTLGGENRFIWHVTLMQWFIYCFISFVIGVVLSFAVINYGAHVYGLSGYIGIHIIPILASLAAILLFIGVRAYISYNKENKRTIANQGTDKRFEQYTPKYPYVIVSAILLLIEIQFAFFGLAMHALIIVLLSVYLTLNIASILLVLLSRLFSKVSKNSIFKIFQLKYLATNKHLHQSLRVLFISLISIVLIFSVRNFMFNEIDNFYETMKFDLALTNIYDYDTDLHDEISHYNTEDYNEAIFYLDVYIHFSEKESQPIKYFVSMDYDSLNNYFNIQANNIDNTYMTNEVPYVILPKNYELVYSLEKGDIVNLDLNYSLENIEFVVAGFFDTNFDNIIFSNLYTIDQYADVAKPNTIFMNSDDPDTLFQDLISDYGSNMYFVLNPDVYFEDLVSGISNITNYFTVFTSYMILCFVIVVFNNTLLVFYAVKSDIARLKVIGADNKMLINSLAKEFIIILAIIVSLGIIEINILSNYLKYIVLLTNFYKDISSTPTTVLYGMVVTTSVLLLSYVYYFMKIRSVHIVEEMKFY